MVICFFFFFNGDWNHGMDYDFPIILGILTPSEELVFFRGVGVPPKKHIIHRSSPIY